MTNEMKYLMHLYACAAGSVCAVPPEYNVDFKKLYALAQRMSLLSMLAYALKISPNVNCPEEIKSSLYGIMLGTSLKNKMKLEALLEVLDQVEKAGFKTILLKGLDCARFYSKPECRISADADLFVEKRDEKALLTFFEENGYTVRRRKRNEHHSECVSPKTGMIEVHTKIWENHINHVMPQKVKVARYGVASSVMASVGGKSIRVLAPTEAMIFMTLHLVKHFIFGGASLKMSYDLALYYVRCKDQVDSESYKAWVKNTGYETVVSALFSAMVDYCGFSKEDFSDISSYHQQHGEIFASNLERYDSGVGEHRASYLTMLSYCSAYNNLRSRGKVYAFCYNAIMVTKRKAEVLFPSRSHLEKSYPYLKKRPYLYLAACTHRFFSRGMSHVFHADPKNGSVLHYQENIDEQLSPAEEKQIQDLQNMGLL